jgi:geranylgeranyl pyrophosphate synthase
MTEQTHHISNRAHPASQNISLAFDQCGFDDLRVLFEEDCHQALVRHSSAPLTEMMGYALHGGKCLRGLLVLAVSDSCNGSRGQARDAAVAIEMLHAASLAVDDLPALDDTSMRRGTQSLHKRFGESAAILTAHALVASAFEIMTQIPNEPDRLLRITSRLATAIGGNGMALAQFVERPDPTGPKTDVRALKTGSLFQMATLIGAVLAGATKELAEDLGELGLKVGIFYQIVDDFRDDLMDPSDREVLREEGLRTWRECFELFDFVRDRLYSDRPLQEWLSRVHGAGARVLDPDRSQLKTTANLL